MRHPWLAALLLTTACSAPTAGLRVGQEVDGQPLFEAQPDADPLYDVLCLPGPGVQSVETSPQAGSWRLRWTSAQGECLADMALEDRPAGPSLRLGVPATQSELWLLDPAQPLTLILGADGRVSRR